MTRQHFELIATIVREAQLPSTAARVNVAVCAADMLAETNPRFDRARFLRACMPSWVPGTRHEAAWERAIAR